MPRFTHRNRWKPAAFAKQFGSRSASVRRPPNRRPRCARYALLHRHLPCSMQLGSPWCCALRHKPQTCWTIRPNPARRQIWYASQFVGCADQKPINKIELPSLPRHEPEAWSIDRAMRWAGGSHRQDAARRILANYFSTCEPPCAPTSGKALLSQRGLNSLPAGRLRGSESPRDFAKRRIRHETVGRTAAVHPPAGGPNWNLSDCWR
jgi:hypothetical protein